MNDQRKKPDWIVFATFMGCALFWVVFALLLSLLASCVTEREVMTSQDYHRIDNLMQRMDSVIRKQQTTVQDSAWHETVIHELQSIKERNDTSHYVVVDSAGKIIKETTIIYRERESVSESDREEREYLMHRLEQMDSIASANSVLIQRMDSAMQASQKEKVVQKQTLSWWQKKWAWLKGFLIGLAIASIIYFTKSIWKKWTPVK